MSTCLYLYFSITLFTFSFTFNFNIEPDSYLEAVSCSNSNDWLSAMNSEIKSLQDNDTWSLVDKPDEAEVIPCKWVYRVKNNADGSVNKFKARLVVRGFSQIKGLNYEETFSPVARRDTIRSLLSVAASKRMYLKQFDVSTAFLYGELEETIYIDQPEGFSDNTDKVCKLKKSLYGLKQAPRCWNQRINKFLFNLGFIVSAADPCLFIRERNGKIILALYADDGLIASTDEQELVDFINQLKNEFKITVNDARYFLGIQIDQNSDGSIMLSQPMQEEN